MNINTDQLAQQCVEAINGKIKNYKPFMRKKIFIPLIIIILALTRMLN